MNERRIRIVFITLYTEMGGGEYGLYYLVKHLDRNRFEPIVVVNGDGPLVKLLNDINVETVTIPFDVVMLKEALTGRSFTTNFRAARQLRAYLKSSRPDIVQCSDVLSLLLLIPALLTMRLRLVYSVIFFYEWPRAILFNVLALAFIDKVVFLSKILRDDLGSKTIGLKRKFETIYWGVDTSRFTPIDDGGRATLRRKLGLPIDKKIVGFIGRYDVWKGHLTFLDAAMSLARESSDAVFLLVGGVPTGKFFPSVGAYKQRVDRWIADHPMGDQLIVWGHRDDVPEIMSCLDVFVCSSDYEPFGLIVLEALAAGQPVVISDTAGALEVIGDQMGVYIAESKKSTSFSRMIKKALVLRKRVDAGKILARYSWESYSDNYQVLYNESR